MCYLCKVKIKPIVYAISKKHHQKISCCAWPWANTGSMGNIQKLLLEQGNSSEYTIENETWYSNAKDFNEEEIINSINSLINE